MRVTSPKDFIAGLLFLAIGLIGLWVAREYPVGTAFRMGPGYLPHLLLYGLILLGAAIAARGFVIEEGFDGPFAWRALIGITAALILFGLLVERLGLVITTVAAVLAASLAGQGARWREMVLVAAGLAAFAAGLFAYALRLPIPVWPRL